MTGALTWFARATVGGAVLIGVLAMHALTKPSPAGSAMTVESMTEVPAIAAGAHRPPAAPTHMIGTVLSGADASMCGHTPCVAILRGHAHSPVPGQVGQVGVPVNSVNSAGASDASLLSSQRAPPPGAALTRLCISRT